jgi:ATP-binding cassette subfamily F protein uup
MTYLQNFLFTPDRARSPARALSGGERSRLLLARLFSEPANLLVLDEPTNDLDVETLDLLEELLGEFAGTVLLVSHDREFLDNVVTRCFAFEGEGRVGDYVGGYSDWLRQRPARMPNTEREERKAAPPSPAPAAAAPPARSGGRLSYKQQRELESLPGKIEQLEAEQTKLTTVLGNPDIYQNDKQAALAAQQRLIAIADALAAAYARWEELEAGRK